MGPKAVVEGELSLLELLRTALLEEAGFVILHLYAAVGVDEDLPLVEWANPHCDLHTHVNYRYVYSTNRTGNTA